MKFHLVGTVYWAVGSCRDDRSEEINEEFDAPSEEVAIEKAKAIVRERHKACSHLTDYGLNAELRVIKPVWETHFRDDEPARRPVPAQPARPAVAAHFEEKRLS